jgi:glycosyltransferase involved in cell wall biosynthesis
MTSTPASVAERATPTLSLVVPVFNEAQRLEATLPRFVAWLRDAPFTSELVVVDDGSVDGTADLAAQLLPAGMGRVLREPHRGKGGAVRAGMLAAEGHYRLFMDVDLATPLEFVTPCLSRLQGGGDVVIGSRRVAAATIEQHQAPLREFLGRGFSLLSRTISGVHVSDFTCGFKGFSAEAATAIFSRLRVVNWSFDTELLFLATRLGFGIDELPVRWRDDARTKVRIGRDIVGSLSGLLAIRVNHLTGRYRLPR